MLKLKADAVWEKLEVISRHQSTIATHLLKVETALGKVMEKLESLSVKLSASDRMADRLIEMTLIRYGQGNQAAQHRNVSRLDRIDTTTSKGNDLWEEKEEEYPGEGYDALIMP